MHNHIVQEILAIVLKGLAGRPIHFLRGPLSLADSCDIPPDIFSRPFHQEEEEVSDYDTEEFLDGPRDQGRTELEEKKIDELVQGLSAASSHFSPRSSLWQSGRSSPCRVDVFSHGARYRESPSLSACSTGDEP